MTLPLFHVKAVPKTCQKHRFTSQGINSLYIGIGVGIRVHRQLNLATIPLISSVSHSAFSMGQADVSLWSALVVTGLKAVIVFHTIV